MTICICGGGSLGTVIASVLSSKGYTINLLTNHPNKWRKEITATDLLGHIYNGKLSIISSSPQEAIHKASIIILCVPGFLIEDTLQSIKPFISPNTFVGSVFSSTGFFFEAQKILGDNFPLWGFQRVPYIARINTYGISASLLGYKDCYKIAIENAPASDKEAFRLWIEEAFNRPTILLNNYLEASITNSNPLLHTSRLYTMFSTWTEDTCYHRNILFYHEWTDEASELLISMDNELFNILDELPVSKSFISPILQYYESTDAHSLTTKIQSIESFKSICSPMIKQQNGWIPDFSSRYFTEDFAYGLKYIYNLAKRFTIDTPSISKVYEWGISKISHNNGL